MNTNEYDTTELAICVDCTMLLANGEVFDSEGNDIAAEHANLMVAVWGEKFDITLGSLECEYCGADAREAARNNDTEIEDCEPWFSWQSCDGCGSHLGGDREHAVAWQRKS